MRRMAIGFAVCALSATLASTAMAQAPATTGAVPPNPTAAPAAASYYIEFRAAQIGAYGHSYAMYGRLSGNGQPADRHYTDLHPMGNYAIMALGHLLPVPANTTWDPDVLKLPVSSSFRRKLNAAEYQKLLATIQRAQANKQPYWNALSNNCNHYIATLAQAIGMRTPSDLELSYSFVPSLRDLNPQTQTAKPEPRQKTPTASGAATDQPRS
ncbi:MAG: hypothetical protein ACXWKC_17105 [Xanthobacteraceae bacterium]